MGNASLLVQTAIFVFSGSQVARVYQVLAILWDRHNRSQSPGQPLKREFWCVVSFPSKGEAGIWSWSPAHSTLSCGEELRWLLAQWSKSPSFFSQPESSESSSQCSDSGKTEASSLGSPQENPYVGCCLVFSFLPQREAGNWGISSQSYDSMPRGGTMVRECLRISYQLWLGLVSYSPGLQEPLNSYLDSS